MSTDGDLTELRGINPSNLAPNPGVFADSSAGTTASAARTRRNRWIWGTALVPAIVLVLGTCAGGSWLVLTGRWSTASTTADDETAQLEPGTSPHLPGAVATPPAWLLEIGSPFDLRLHFQPVPESVNAAPLQLDALAELMVEVLPCLPRDEEVRRMATVRGQAQRWHTLRQAFRNDPRSVRSGEIAALKVALAPVVAKLALANQRPIGIFATGLDHQAQIPHAQAIRNLVELFAIEGYSRLRQGDVEAAILHLPVGFRLSRDLRRRGGTICQILSFASERALCDHVAMVLSAPGLTVHHCGRLLEMLTSHEANCVDSVTEALKTEYIYLRVTLHDLPRWTGSYSRDKLAARGLQNPTIESVLQKFLNSGRRRARDIDPALRFVTFRDFAIEEAVVDALFFELLAPNKTDEERKAIAQAQQGRIEELHVAKLFFPDLPQFIEWAIWHRTRLAATRAQVVVRRWQLANGGNPSSLEVAAHAAGIETPIDVLSKQPLRLIVLDGDPIIYSVGPDRTDNKAQSEWRFGQTADTGDWLFRIPAWRE